MTDIKNETSPKNLSTYKFINFISSLSSNLDQKKLFLDQIKQNISYTTEDVKMVEFPNGFVDQQIYFPNNFGSFPPKEKIDDVNLRDYMYSLSRIISELYFSLSEESQIFISGISLRKIDENHFLGCVNVKDGILFFSFSNAKVVELLTKSVDDQGKEITGMQVKLNKDRKYLAELVLGKSL